MWRALIQEDIRRLLGGVSLPLESLPTVIDAFLTRS